MDDDLERLGRAVKRVQDRDHRALDAALRQHGVTLVQWDALRALDGAPGASAHDLATATFQSDQAFGTLAARLVAAGWVERRSGHGRRVEHHLTSAGRQVLETGRSVAEAIWPELFAALDAGERRTLLALLERLLRAEPG